MALAALAVASVVQAQPASLPAPIGFVNDFANILDDDTERQLDRLARIVQSRSGGELAIVTLADLGGRPVEETALRIGRDWKVGAKADIGDARRNAGTVILLVPKETSADNRGYCRIESGMGVEGFLTDAEAGGICRSATERFRARDYGGGLLVITSAVAEAYAAEFGFSLAEGELPVSRRPARRGSANALLIALILFFVLMILSSRGSRSGCLPVIVAGSGPPSRYRGGYTGGFGGGFGGGGFGGGFGGGGGGFGGFGGGGGFSGGGGGSSW